MTCLLFILFEFLQGNETVALTHLRSGLKLLKSLHHDAFKTKERSFQKHQTRHVYSSNASLEISSQSSLGEFEEIRRLFGMFDRQAMIWLDLDSLQGSVDTGAYQLGGLRTTPPLDKGFSSLSEAEEFLNVQIFELLRERNLRVGQKSPGASEIQKVVTTQLPQWRSAMDAFLRSFSDSSLEESGQITRMELNYRMALIMLKAAQGADEELVYSNCTPIWEEMVLLAKSLLQTPNAYVNASMRFDALHTSRPMFSLPVGLIMPLYYTAVKCHNRAICDDAISLLSVFPWREGAWDSAAQSKIAERKVQKFEAEGRYDGAKQYELGLALPLDLRQPCLWT